MSSKQLREKDSRVVFEARGLNRIPQAKSANAELTRKLLRAEFEEIKPGRIKFIDVRKFVRLLEESGLIHVVNEADEEVSNAGAEYHALILQAFNDHLKTSDAGQINKLLDNLKRIKLVLKGNRIEIKFLLERDKILAEKPGDIK